MIHEIVFCTGIGLIAGHALATGVQYLRERASRRYQIQMAQLYELRDRAMQPEDAMLINSVIDAWPEYARGADRALAAEITIDGLIGRRARLVLTDRDRALYCAQDYKILSVDIDLDAAIDCLKEEAE